MNQQEFIQALEDEAFDEVFGMRFNATTVAPGETYYRDFTIRHKGEQMVVDDGVLTLKVKLTDQQLNKLNIMVKKESIKRIKQQIGFLENNLAAAEVHKKKMEDA